MIADRWGVTDAETRRRYPCDDIVPVPVLQAWRGVTVRRPADQVWPWIAQIRLAPYSYDWIDNLGRRSPQRLVPGLQDPQVGDRFSTAARLPVGRIRSVARGRHLTGSIAGVAISYVLVPVDDGAGPPSTRLLMKIVSSGWRWTAPLLSVGDLVMARRQLLTIKRLAETQRA